MAKSKVDRISDTWLSVLEAIETDLAKLRKAREVFGVDVRALDRDLGAIKALQKLRDLPDDQDEIEPEKLKGSGIKIPGKKNFIQED